MFSIARAAARPRLTASFARAAASVHTLPALDYSYDVRAPLPIVRRRAHQRPLRIVTRLCTCRCNIYRPSSRISRARS